MTHYINVKPVHSPDVCIISRKPAHTTQTLLSSRKRTQQPLPDVVSLLNWAEGDRHPYTSQRWPILSQRETSTSEGTRSVLLR